jgi:hypothetical protein
VRYFSYECHQIIVQYTLKECPRCGAGFECKEGSILICQCCTVDLTSAQREFMAARYDDCLCVACLRAIQDNHQAVQ